MATTTSIRPTIGTARNAPTLRLLHLIDLWHLTSLDAPTVAVTWTLAFAWSAQIQLPLWLPITLALAAWSFYIADRLLDAHRAHMPSTVVAGPCSLIPVPCSLRPRHHFHWKHRRLFIPLALTAGLAALILVFLNMPLAARERNSVLAAAALAYFTSVHNPWRLPSPKFHLRLPKELLVALIFTLACAVPTLSRISPRIPTPRPELIIPILVFIALAWLNCQAIEAWESTTLTHNPILPLAATLATSSAVIAAIFLAGHRAPIAALLAAAAISAALLALLDRHRHRLTPTTLRAAADLALLTPLALLLMPVFTP